MAINKDIKLENGIEVIGAYLKVEFPTLNKEAENMTFYLRKYKEKGLPFFAEEYLTCPYDIEGLNPFIQAYEYLKTLEEYADAEDC